MCVCFCWICLCLCVCVLVGCVSNKGLWGSDGSRFVGFVWGTKRWEMGGVSFAHGLVHVYQSAYTSHYKPDRIRLNKNHFASLCNAHPNTFEARPPWKPGQLLVACEPRFLQSASQVLPESLRPHEFGKIWRSPLWPEEGLTNRHWVIDLAMDT